MTGVTTNNLQFLIQEFDESGNYLANGPSKVLSVNSADFMSDALIYKTAHPDTAEIGLSFSPMRGLVGTTTVDIDNVQIQVAAPPINGDFESGATVSTGGADVFVDTTSLLGWRLFSVGSPPITRFTGTLVDAGDYTNGQTGTRAMRLDTNNSGSPAAFDYGLDNDNARIQVTSGETYTFSFDVALDSFNGNTIDLAASIAEFDAAGAFTGTSGSITPTLTSDKTFYPHTLDYTITNPNTTQVVLSFRPATSGQSAVIIDNVEFAPFAENFPSPQLSIERQGTSVELSWPESYLGWLLQTNGNLKNVDQWSDIEGTDSKTNQTVPITPALIRQFFRLREP